MFVFKFYGLMGNWSDAKDSLCMVKFYMMPDNNWLAVLVCVHCTVY